MQTLSTPPAAQRDPDLAQADPAIYEAIQQEQERQRMKIELIASENYVSRAVLEAQGSVLTNKYAEGYPGKRYYGGCEYVDIAERLAIERAKELFGADHANVQPHSGAQANMAAYMAVLQPGDTMLGMSLAHGGHLTHGYKINFSGQLYQRLRPTACSRARSASTTTRWPRRRCKSGPSCSWPGPRPTRASSTSPACARSPTAWARCCWSTWPTSPGWSRPASTPRPCRTPISSRRPRTRRCAGRAAA